MVSIDSRLGQNGEGGGGDGIAIIKQMLTGLGRTRDQVAMDDAGEHRRRGVWQRGAAGVGVPGGLCK